MKLEIITANQASKTFLIFSFILVRGDPLAQFYMQRGKTRGILENWKGFQGYNFGEITFGGIRRIVEFQI